MRWLVLIAFLGIIAFGAAVIILWPKANSPIDNGSPIVASKTTIFDLSTDAAKLLQGVPGIVKVEVVPPKGKPKRRIIHLLDWEFYAIEANGPVAQAFVDKALEIVEAVQADQRATLTELVLKHGLEYVLIARLTEKNADTVAVKAAALRIAGEKQVKLATQIDEVRAALANAVDGSEQHTKLRTVEKEIEETQAAYNRDKLNMGAAFGLYLVGLLKGVLPLDDDALLAAANPLMAEMDKAAKAKRQQSMVANALKVSPVSVIVCDGDHDFAWLLDEETEYVRVSGPVYEQLAAERSAPRSRPNASKKTNGLQLTDKK